MRAVVVGRKNWLFFGSDKGGERAAVIYSLIASCKLHGIDPGEYLADVLLRVHSTPPLEVWRLTPVAWKELREARQPAPGLVPDAAAPAAAAAGQTAG